jgi:GNAT acetyltransferase
MQCHVEAEFTHDAHGCLLRVNDAGAAPAPRFFLGRTAEGDLLRFRHDLGQDARRALKAIVESHARSGQAIHAPIDPAPYQEILGRLTPAERTWTGPAFSFPNELPIPAGVARISEANAHVLHPFFEEWLPDVRLCQPMFALTVDGQAASLCCSVRQTGMAHEAGVETAAQFRGRGYAARVVVAWARAVKDAGRIPLYSTSWTNEASRGVARRLALTLFGNDVHIS